VPIKFSINITTIILIIIVIGAFCFFLFSYTPSKLKKAEEEYTALKKSLEEKNKESKARIKVLEMEKDEIRKKIQAEEEKSEKLEREIETGEKKLATALARIKRMPDDEIVNETRVYLNEYLQKTKTEEPKNISDKDIFKMRNNVSWSFFAMKTNFSVLTEHESLKFTLVPKLEEKAGSLEKQKTHYFSLYKKQLGITEECENMYENEKALREKCESTYEICKKQLGKGKVKSFLMGSGVGAAIVFVLTLIK